MNTFIKDFKIEEERARMRKIGRGRGRWRRDIAI